MTRQDTPQAIVDALRQFLITRLQIVGAEGLDSGMPLVQRGVLDSIELMQVVSFIEQEYQVKVDDTEMVPENLRSLDAMAAFVRRKLGTS